MRWIILTFLLTINASLMAQDFELTSINLTVQDGLAGDNVYCAVQDKDGYIWFGTETGVSRYNGRDFESFYMSDGLGDNEIFRIDQDSFGRIWFSGFNKKLSFYKDGKFYNDQNYEPFKDLSLGSHYINLLEDTQGNIWFTTVREVYAITPDGNVIVSPYGPRELRGVQAFREENGMIFGFNLRDQEIKFSIEDGEIRFEAVPFLKQSQVQGYEKYLRLCEYHLTKYDLLLANSLLDSLISPESFQMRETSKSTGTAKSGFFARMKA